MSANSGVHSTSSHKVLKRKKSSLSEIRITVLGERNVGKTAIVVRFLTRRYIIEYEHGSDKRYKNEVLIENEPVIFDILDTSSTLPATSSTVHHLPFGDVLLLVYAITDRESFNYIRSVLRHIAEYKGYETGPIQTKPLVAIVGNKSDLIHLRQVSREEGEILSHENSNLNVLYLGEYSAADMQLHTLFFDLFKWVKRHKVLSKTPNTPSLLDRVVIGIKGSTANGSS